MRYASLALVKSALGAASLSHIKSARSVSNLAARLVYKPQPYLRKLSVQEVTLGTVATNLIAPLGQVVLGIPLSEFTIKVYHSVGIKRFCAGLFPWRGFCIWFPRYLQILDLFVLLCLIFHILITAGQLAQQTGLPTIVPAYRLAPENPHPTQLIDCLATVMHCQARFGPKNMILAGDSAGGNLVLTGSYRLISPFSFPFSSSRSSESNFIFTAY